MRKLFGPIILLTTVMAIGVVPFVLFGSPLERQAEEWLDTAISTPGKAALIIGLLAGDILLPTPSSLVNTFAGSALGFFGGTAAAWLGMTLGAILGFALARACGRPLARRLSSEDELQQIDALSARFGPGLLVLSRAVPVLAEASVLFFGTTDLSWRRFLVPVVSSNLVIAAGYAAMGNWIALPIAIPLALAISAVTFLLASRPVRKDVFRPGSGPPEAEPSLTTSTEEER